MIILQEEFDQREVDVVIGGGVNATELERNPFLQWIQGIFGVTTTEAPVLLSPPDDCEACCEFLLSLKFSRSYVLQFICL